MTSPTYGLIFNNLDDDPRPSQPSDLSIIGLVLPSDDADAPTFPLNVPVAFDTGDPDILPLLGTGPLAEVVVAIDDQLADLQVSARCVAIRVASGQTIDATIANIVGSRSAGTGLYALLQAGTMLGEIPRLIGAPGFTGHTNFAVASVSTAGTGGTGYTSAPTVAFNPAGATAHAVVANGAVTVVLDSPGSYEPGVVPTVTFTGGGGTGAAAVVTMVQLANPIVAALPEILSALLGNAVVGGPGTGQQDAVNWMQTISDERLIPVDNWNIVAAGTTTNPTTAYEDGAARVLGLGVRTDFKNGNYPFKSFAGQPVQNILGLKQNYSFSLLDGATQGQELLADHIGITERGSIGVETAVSASGFEFIGVFNASNDPTWWFYNKIRTRDYIQLGLIKSVRLRLGVDNVTPHAVQAVLNDMTVVLADVAANGGSVGWSVGFSAASNSAAALRQGQFRLNYKSEAPAPITQVTIDESPDYDALTIELATIVAQAASLVPQYAS